MRMSTAELIRKYVLPISSIGIVTYHMVQVIWPLQQPWFHLNTHLGLAFIICYLSVFTEMKRHRWTVVPLLVLSIVAIVYMQINQPRLEENLGFPNVYDTIIGIVLIIITMDICRRVMSPVLPLAVLALIAYALIGHHLPGFMSTWEFSPIQVIAHLTTNLSGIYGMLLEVSAFYIYLFVVMGGIIQVTAAMRFFNVVGNLASRAMRGGPAMSAVITSALVGTSLGSTSANVAITGSFTIPLMKKSGYAPHEAAAIEAAASNGGMIMPPVMGAAAFVMAQFIGVSYFEVVVAAIIPALLYFFCAGLYVQLTALKKNLKPEKTNFNRADIKEMLVAAPSFLAPLAVITILLSQGFSPLYASFWAVVTCILLGLITPGSRPSLTAWVRGFTNGAKAAATIAISMATVSMIVEMFLLTGLGLKIPVMVEAWSQGNLILAILLVAVSSLILGMGMPATPAYIIVAISAAPVLVRMGIPLLNAHFFVFYYSVMALVTPPVAGAAVISSRLANAGYFRTGLEAVKVALAGFIVPIMFISAPVFILRPEGTVFNNIALIFAGALLLFSAQVAFVNCYFTTLHSSERALSIICSLTLFWYVLVRHDLILLFAGLTFFVLLTILQIRSRSLSKTMS